MAEKGNGILSGVTLVLTLEEAAFLGGVLSRLMLQGPVDDVERAIAIVRGLQTRLPAPPAHPEARGPVGRPQEPPRGPDGPLPLREVHS
jgi:hypothetical protein